MERIHLTKNTKRLFVFLSCLLMLLMIFVMSQSHQRLLIQNSVEIGLNEVFEPRSYIQPRFDHQNLMINSKVDSSKYGQYLVEYKYKNQKEKLEVNVVDKIAPEFNVYTQTIVKGQKINKTKLVGEVIDDSKTKVILDQKYKFNKPGEYEIGVCVKDSYRNQTCQKTKVIVQPKDKEAPVISGLTPLVITQGQEANYDTGVSISDNIDQNPTYSIDFADFDNKTVGVYQIKYNAVDFQGNKSTYSREVTVKEIEESTKILYLTFDDGPSINTPKVLEVLSRYQVKASFFVTGASPDYYHYIKEANLQGHTIGMHTYCHNYEYLYGSIEQYQEDIEKISQVVKSQIGYIPKYIRFPGGTSNTISKQYQQGIMKQIVDFANQNDFIYIDWNAANGDGESYQTVPLLIEKAKNSGKGKTKIMMLMHDGGGSAKTVEALPAIIEHYQNLGYEFRAIDQTTPEFHHGLAN